MATLTAPLLGTGGNAPEVPGVIVITQLESGTVVMTNTALSLETGGSNNPPAAGYPTSG